MTNPKVAVLGAGLQGVGTALELSRRGVDVELFDQDDVALNRASLRNEGKIHLGFVYANDPTTATAHTMLEGAVRFGRLLDDWSGGGFGALRSSHPFHYLVAGDSMVSPDDLAGHYDRVEQRFRELVRSDPDLDYLGTRPDSLVRPLTPAELADASPEAAAAGFATAELAIDVPAMATVMRQALAASPVRFRTGHHVLGVERGPSGFQVTGSNADGPWTAGCHQVVNALWAGRMAIDATVGLAPERSWIHRLKYRVLVRLPASVRPRASVTVVLGPYGDVVVHPDGTGNVSWYPTCMRARSSDLAPPEGWDAACRGEPDPEEAAGIARAALEGAEPWLPGIRHAEPLAIGAGVIVAWGHSDIDDAASELHRREAIGVESVDGYHTVNTGKLTTAPMFAVEAADRVTDTGDAVRDLSA